MKETTKAMWSLGDYSLLANQLEEASRRLVEACGISSGQEVLDVAAGNGNCSIAAARRGARVVASDLTPAMVQLGQARTAAEGLDIEWVEADVEDLPFEPGRFDCVTSVFGAMIAPRPEIVASEMFRVAKPGGTVGMANWTPDSLMKKMGDVASRYSPPSPVEVPSPFTWGDEHTVRSRFGGLASSIEAERRALLWEAESLGRHKEVQRELRRPGHGQTGAAPGCVRQHGERIGNLVPRAQPGDRRAGSDPERVPARGGTQGLKSPRGQSYSSAKSQIRVAPGSNRTITCWPGSEAT